MAKVPLHSTGRCTPADYVPLGHVLPVFSLVTPAIFQEIAAAVTEDLVKAGETTTLDLVLTPETNRLAN